MKKLLTAKHLSLLMLLSLLGGKAEATRHQDEDGYASESRGGCCPISSCYECGCNPLYCGAWDLQVQGGVAPILWRNRAPILGVNCANAALVPPAPVVVPLFANVPKFRTFFKTPWLVGGQVGYAWSDNTRVYVEFNYSQAKAKSDVSLSTVAATGVPLLPFLFNFAKYKVFDAHVGARYYWDRWCDRVSFFLGGKVGVTHHKNLSSSLSFVAVAPTAPTLASTAFFGRNTVVSGGGNVGFDICFWGNWSLVFTGEVVASAGPRALGDLLLPTAAATAAGYSDLIIGNIQTELRFPVTAAIRYSF